MTGYLRSQIYSRMNLKETDELLNIWQQNNRTVWSDEAFDVIKDILQERGEQIPDQKQPVYEVDDEQEESTDDGLEEWEAKVLDNENQPDFYDTLEVLELRDNVNRIAIGVIVVYTLLCLSSLQITFSILQGIHLSFSEALSLLRDDLLTIVVYGLQIVVIYFPLKAIPVILRILMEMEFRSRKAN